MRYCIQWPFLLIILLASCHQSDRKDVLISKDYSITIEARGCLPGGIKFKAVIYNVPQYQILNYSFYKPHHLYTIRQEPQGDSLKVETYDLELTPAVEDSILWYVHKYLTDFTIDNKIELTNGIHSQQIILDGECLSVQLEYDNRLIKCEQYNLKSLSHASSDIKSLLKIINSRMPEKFQLY
jgi:hypothetical protein